MLKAGTVAALAVGWMLGPVFSAAPPASAAAPTGNQLRWLPYGPSGQDAGRRVSVAARDAEPRWDTSVNPVRQAAQTSPLDDPFGDAGSGRRRAQPLVLVNQAGPASAPATAPVGSDSAAGQPAAAETPRPNQETAVKVTESQLKKEKPIAFKCRSLKELERIGQLTNTLAVPSNLKSYQVRINKLACPLDDTTLPQREKEGWQPTTFTWKASGLCHKPLYFEQAHVERYGHSTGPLSQPLVSGAEFFLTVPVLPYEMGLYPPRECMYTLGYYRPGSCAPYYLEPIPLSVRAGLIEAGAWLGAIYVIP